MGFAAFRRVSGGGAAFIFRKVRGYHRQSLQLGKLLLLKHFQLVRPEAQAQPKRPEYLVIGRFFDVSCLWHGRFGIKMEVVLLAGTVPAGIRKQNGYG